MKRCSNNYEWNTPLNNCSCPHGWLRNPSNQCYYKSKSNETLNWDAAELYCKNRNAHLISINSQDEFDYFNSIRDPLRKTWANK